MTPRRPNDLADAGNPLGQRLGPRTAHGLDHGQRALRTGDRPEGPGPADPQLRRLEQNAEAGELGAQERHHEAERRAGDADSGQLEVERVHSEEERGLGEVDDEHCAGRRRVHQRAEGEHRDCGGRE